MIADSIRWIFRPHLLVAGIAALLAWGYLGKISDDLAHEGPYIVAYGEDGEDVREVSRNDFLRHNVTMSVVMLLFSACVWGIAAKSLKDKDTESEATIASLKNRLSLLEEAMKHDRSCRCRVDKYATCNCPNDDKQRVHRDIVELWTAAGSSPVYDKKAWSSIVNQLKSLDLI